MQALAELAVEEERWEDAQQLVAGHPELAETVCLPWAEWLVAKGSFHEARLAYRYRAALPAVLTHKLVDRCCSSSFWHLSKCWQNVLQFESSTCPRCFWLLADPLIPHPSALWTSLWCSVCIQHTQCDFSFVTSVTSALSH